MTVIPPDTAFVYSTSTAWRQLLYELLNIPEETPSPRGRETREQIAGRYRVFMPAFIDLVDRDVNVAFMFAEAAWILSGSNRLADIRPFMDGYQAFSDDGVFLQGAYGPRVVDQLGYVVDCLEADNDSRQAFLSIWRDRPRPAKDIACTTSMQFLLRRGKLHSVTTMRSQDVVYGYTFDVVTFSAVANAVRLLLKERGVESELGHLTVNAGSLHLYRDPFGKGANLYEKAEKWVDSTDVDPTIGERVRAAWNADSYEDFIERLWRTAYEANGMQR